MLFVRVAVAAFFIVATLSFIRSEESSEELVAPPSSSNNVPELSEADRAAVAGKEEKFEFQAEVSRLMDIIINSLYSNREIFIRELVSNAADALDKVKYLSLTGATSLGDHSSLEVRISFDKDAKTITIQDSGIGMSKDHLIKHLGVLASSGTTEFLEAATKGQDALSLIGQFGVGFYSVYLVADRVVVTTKHNDDKQYIWESTADAVFTVVEDPRGPTLGRGTAVTLHLKQDAEEYLNEVELEKLVKRYSEFINWPIYLRTTKQVDKEVPVEEEAVVEEKKEEKEGEELEVEEEKKEDKPKTKTIKETVNEWKRINDVKAIWTRAPSEITDSEYQQFYKSISKDENGALDYTHFTAEGEITFKSILYIPEKAPSNLYDKFYDKSTALRLYVRRVLISDEFEDFLPRYLNFVKGVVDSEDLPLNVSRETLAQNKVLKVMAKKLTRKVLEMLKKLADDSKEEDKKEEEEKKEEGEEVEKKKENKYDTFWKNFGKSIKLGVIDDRTNKAKLAKLLRFTTSKSEGKLIGLEDYVDRMKEGQKAIYFITGESEKAVRSSPFLERLTKKGYEVVLMVDPLDEYLSQSLTEFDGKPLKSITRANLVLDDDDKERLSKLKDEFKEVTTWLEKVYGDRVQTVTVSNRISHSPCVLVTGEYGWSANMERIMKAQTFANVDEASYMFSRKTMEINPYHPIIKALKSKIADGSVGTDDKNLVNDANLLYDAALLVSGFSHKEPNDFASRIHRVIAHSLEVDPNAQVEEEPEYEPSAASEDASTEQAADSNDFTHEHEEL